MGARWLVVVALACASAPAWADSGTKDEPQVIVRQVGAVRVELREGSILNDDPSKWPAAVGIAADGTELWRVEHPAQYGAFIEPVVLGSHLVYARRADLLDLDVDLGRIVGRYRFPARITEIQSDADGASSGGLLVHIRSANPWDREQPEVTVHYRLGQPAPGRSPWDPLGMFTAHSDAAALWDTWDRSLEEARRPPPLAPAEATAIVERCARSLERDGTNPFLHFFHGRALAAAGRPEEASAAYTAATQLPDAIWTDLILMSTLMEVRGIPQADLAFERGYDRMLQAGVRPERLQSTIFSLMMLRATTKWLTAEALEAGDTERVHELETKRWRLSPKLESAPRAWRALAAWMREQDRPDLAKLWSERAAVAEDGWINRSTRDVRCALERTFPFLLGLLYAVPLALLVIGIRSMSERFGWRAGARAFATVAAPALLAFFVAAWPPIWRDWVVRGDIPDDSLGAPQVAAALELQPSSAARDAVLAYARAQAEAIRAGHNYDGPMPDEATLAAALAPTPTWRQSLDEANRKGVTAMPWYRIDTDWRIDHPLEIALLLLIPLLFGVLLARFLPRLARAITEIVPGAARGFSAGSGLAIGLFLGGLLAVTGWFERFWEGEAGRYFGLDAIWERGLDRPSNTWAWFLVLGILALQLWLVVRARRRQRTAARTDGIS